MDHRNTQKQYRPFAPPTASLSEPFLQMNHELRPEVCCKFVRSLIREQCKEKIVTYLMSFKIDVRIKNNKLFVKTLSPLAHIMIMIEMLCLNGRVSHFIPKKRELAHRRLPIDHSLHNTDAEYRYEH